MSPMPIRPEAAVREKAGEDKREGKSAGTQAGESLREEEQHSPLEDLSRRESEVFRLIGLGHTTRQIAEILRISAKTVESYQAHIKEKLSLRNARELIQRAVEWTLANKQA
jgi:DNA-binding CsgD family transcriptional regulator